MLNQLYNKAKATIEEAGYTIGITWVDAERQAFYVASREACGLDTYGHPMVEVSFAYGIFTGSVEICSQLAK